MESSGGPVGLEPENFTRLQQEHAKVSMLRKIISCIISVTPQALRATQETIRKWQVLQITLLTLCLAYDVCREQFKYDYEVLQARLHTLPDRLTHDVMVRSFNIRLLWLPIVTIGTVWAIWVHARSSVPHQRGNGTLGRQLVCTADGETGN